MYRTLFQTNYYKNKTPCSPVAVMELYFAQTSLLFYLFNFILHNLELYPHKFSKHKILIVNFQLYRNDINVGLINYTIKNAAPCCTVGFIEQIIIHFLQDIIIITSYLLFYKLLQNKETPCLPGANYYLFHTNLFIIIWNFISHKLI